MRSVSFTNDGLIDMRAVTTFGVSSKESATPIGYFGTGLKYAIAVFLRLGCEITIYRGLERFDFGVERQTIRVDDFDVVTMNGEARAYTTELGKNWEAWQAFRELWCNALDEPNGDVYPIASEPTEDTTTVVVTGVAAVECYHTRDSILLMGSPHGLYDGVEVSMKSSKHMYFRNVRVGELSKPAMFTWNVVGHGMTLTEDRTLKNPHYFGAVYVRDAITKCDDPYLVEQIIYAKSDTFEGSIDFTDADPGLVLKRLMEEARWARIDNKTLVQMMRKHTQKEFKPRQVDVDENTRKILERALALLETGLNIRVEYKIVVTDELEDHILGLAKDNTIYITHRAVMMGTKTVAGTIYEEWIHLHHGLHDESRALQNFLVDAVVTAAEKVVGDPA